jgi:hypothetical protein
MYSSARGAWGCAPHCESNRIESNRFSSASADKKARTFYLGRLFSLEEKEIDWCRLHSRSTFYELMMMATMDLIALVGGWHACTHACMDAWALVCEA